GPTPVASGFVVRTTTVDGATYRYQVFVPRRAGRGGRPPVILYLHGAGERGTDGDLQTMVGLGPVMKGRAESFPAIVVLPQAPRVWLFHGDADPAVPVGESRSMAEALRRAGGDVRYTEYAGVGHNSWESAYNEPELWRWLFAQRLGRRSPAAP